MDDVWSSDDGVTWVRQTEHAPWTPRTGVFSVVAGDRLWLYGGKGAGDWSGDVWTLDRTSP